MHVVKERCYKVIPTVVTLGTILLFCGVLFKIIANHGQFFFNHVFGIVISVFAAILVVTFEAAGCVNRWTKSFLVIHSILVLLYIGAFYTNTLLPYETWLDKNMPESSFQKLTSK